MDPRRGSAYSQGHSSGSHSLNPGANFMSTITQPITVKQYDRMIEAGIIGEHDQVELIEGRLVPKSGA